MHILPCENPGSLQHRISMLVKDGINERNGRFFNEDPSHLRRLNTNQMNLLARKYGFNLSNAYYSYHYWTAIQGITSDTPMSILKMTDYKKAKNRELQIELKRLRNELLRISILRRPAISFEQLKNMRWRSKLRWTILNLFLAAFYPVSFSTNSYINRKAEQEWDSFKNQENGSEMYLFYNRGNASYSTKD